MKLFRPSSILSTAFAMGVSLLALLILTGDVRPQNNDDSLIPGKRSSEDEQPKTVKEYLAKQRAAKAKKDHEELLKRGDEVVELTDELESAFTKSHGLTAADRVKLESLEKAVTRIRKGLGGDDDDEEEAVLPNSEGGPSVAEKEPSTLSEAFTALKERTAKLVDELKKTTRFTVSAIAIQSSNSVLKLVRFLKLRK